MQRECTICKVQKPFEEFAKSKKGKYGIEAQCKKCKYARSGREYYLKNKDKCHKNASKWVKKNREAINKKNRERYEENPEKVLERMRKYRKSTKTYLKSYRKRHPEKIRAQSQLQDHVKRGNIIKPSNCSICNSEKWIEAHHADYNKPLVVVWVCKKCHNAIHKRLKF